MRTPFAFITVYTAQKSIGRVRIPCLHTAIHSRTRQFSLLRTPRPRRQIASCNPLPRNFSTSQILSSTKRENNFTYALSASFTAKDHPYNPTKHVYNFPYPPAPSSSYPPKDIRPLSGQDAFFISSVPSFSPSHSSLALGIADGVGGWADSGVDPSDFSHGLCQYMASTAISYTPQPSSQTLTPLSLLSKGYSLISRDRSVLAGGSTACISMLSPNGRLSLANLGDSGFAHLRLGAVHHVSSPQTHAFNTPYQLSLVPEAVERRARAFGGEQLKDMPEDAVISEGEVRHGDVLVFASDGVWDNLSSSDVLRTVSRIMVSAGAWIYTEEEGIQVSKHLSKCVLEVGGKEKASAERGGKGKRGEASLQEYLAVGITGEAKRASVNTKRDGPFAREVQRYYPGENWRGGKVDDICVVVTVVVET